MDKQNQEVVDYVLGALPNKKAKILSIGCGYGDKEIYLSRKGYDVTALDNSPIMGMLQSRYAGEVNFISQADARALPLPDDSFDFIMMLNVIYAIPNSDLHNMFAEFHRVLKKGGGFIISSSATLGATERIKKKLKILSQLLAKKEKPIKAGQSQKQTGWLRDRREVEKYLPYKDYKSIRYNGSLCIGMKYRNTVKHNILRLLSKVCTFDSYYDVWVAKGRK
jgi:ubiquinone/menaquinone biosynthesis C-methylase UbiE